MPVELDTTRVLVLSIAVLWLGSAVTRLVPPLRRFSIPIAVTGGILCSLAVAAIDALTGTRITFDLSLRDTLLLVFFSTIGLSAKLRLLSEGGRTLLRLALVTLVFLATQNAIGIAIVSAAGSHWAYGLMAGSVSLAGGHGTALTWGRMASEGGLEGAIPLGMAFATFGLICGGLVGGPIAGFLLRRHRLEGPSASEAGSRQGESPSEEEPVSVTSSQVIRTIFFLAISIGVGAELNRWMGEREIVLPGFLTAMGVGILLTNLADARKQPVAEETVTLLNDVSLHLFLAMSLMSMDFSQLAGSFFAIALVLGAQVAMAVAFAIFVVFRFCGRDYDAAVIASGYAGLGLGATPVGVANMNAVTSRFGASPKAFLVVPLVGAFLLDILNAFVIQTYIGILR